MIGDQARTVLIVTDDSSFSALVSEQMLQADVRTLRFARSQEALNLARTLSPTLVLVHMPRGCLDAGWDCYHMLQSDSALAAIPILFYAPSQVLAERAVGAPADSQPADRLDLSDTLVGQISLLLGIPAPRKQHASVVLSEQPFLSGRDDL